MKAKNWTQKLYNTELEHRLWEYMPFLDLTDAAEVIRAVQATDYWLSLVPKAPVPVVVQRGKTWYEQGGVDKEYIRKVRGKIEYIITYPIGCVSLGFTIHELPHVIGKWREGHDNQYMKVYFSLWKMLAPNAYFRVVKDMFESRGIPVGDFLS